MAYSTAFASAAAVSSAGGTVIDIGSFSIKNNDRNNKPNQDQACAFAIDFDAPPDLELVTTAIKALCEGLQNCLLACRDYPIQRYSDTPSLLEWAFNGGTTLSGAVVIGSEALLFNIGDSKTVVVGTTADEVKLTAETEQHNPESDEYMGEQQGHISDQFAIRLALKPPFEQLKFVPEHFLREDSSPYPGLKFSTLSLAERQTRPEGMRYIPLGLV